MDDGCPRSDIWGTDERTDLAEDQDRGKTQINEQRTPHKLKLSKRKSLPLQLLLDDLD